MFALLEMKLPVCLMCANYLAKDIYKYLFMFIYIYVSFETYSDKV